MKKIIKKISLVIISLSCVQVSHLSAADPVLSAQSVTVQENLEQLIQTRSCRGCDLAGLDFKRMDLSGVDLEGADLSSGKFYLTNLAGANLKNTKLNGSNFGGADLGEADLRGADLEGASLDSAYLGDTLLDGDSAEMVSEEVVSPSAVSQIVKDTSSAAEPEKTSEMIGSSTETSIPEPPPAKNESLVTGQKYNAPEKREVAVTDAEKSIITGDQKTTIEANVSDKLVVDQSTKEKVGGSDQKTTGDDLTESEITEVTTQPEPASEVADLVVIDEIQDGGNTLASDDEFSEDLLMANIKKSNLARLLDNKKCFGCDLSGLDISNKNLKGADLEKADLSGCNLEGAKLDGANLKDSLLQRANLRNASLKKADLYKADLTDADLTNAKVKGALLDGAIISEAIGLVSESSVLMN